MAKKKTEPDQLQSGKVVYIDLNVYVGEAAGILWKTLGQYGPLDVESLPAKTRLPIPRAYGGMGWLACEGKIQFIRHDTGKKSVALTPAEQAIYDRTQTEQQRLLQKAELDLWFAFRDELDKLGEDPMPDQETLRQQIELIRQLVAELDPADRKLLTAFCKGKEYQEYQELRQLPELAGVELPALRRRVHDLINRLRDAYMTRTQPGSRPRERTTNPVCAGFALDLTDYATKCRECLPLEKQRSLVAHILKCPACRCDFLESLHIYALVAMPEETPESQQKMHDFIARLTKMKFTKDKE